MSAPVNAIFQRQIELNATTRDCWATYTGHRQHVMALLDAAGEAGGRLCVLGAGNCNDLDLPALLERYREVHLVDVDACAVEEGVSSQGVTIAPRLERHLNVDLTGMADIIAGWTPAATLGESDLERLRTAPLNQAAPRIAGPFDVVLSACVLSQIVGDAALAIGGRHSQLVSLIQAVRLGHLRLLVELLRPGGCGVLVSDLFASDTCPALPTVAEDRLPHLMANEIARRNFFHGVQPAALLAAIQNDPVLGVQTSHVVQRSPWRWSLGPRTYAVYAVTLRRNRIET